MYSAIECLMLPINSGVTIMTQRRVDCADTCIDAATSQDGHIEPPCIALSFPLLHVHLVNKLPRRFGEEKFLYVPLSS